MVFVAACIAKPAAAASIAYFGPKVTRSVTPALQDIMAGKGLSLSLLQVKSSGVGPAIATFSTVVGVVKEGFEQVRLQCANSNLFTYWTKTEEKRSGFPYVIPMGMSIIAAIDIYMGGVLLHSIPLLIDTPLKTWVAGGLLLSMPTSALVERVADRMGFRAAFLIETAFTLASFIWLALGTMWVSDSSLALTNAPLLWWSCYFSCIAAWSAFGTIIFCMIFTTVLSLMFGHKSAQL